MRVFALLTLSALSLHACGRPKYDTYTCVGCGAVFGDTGYRDDDGDGYGYYDDCDDQDPDVNPSGQEECDGVDNDCDGDIDEGVMSTYYADADRDGYGTELYVLEDCEASKGWVGAAGDCEDQDESINPAAAEACDGVDNDCDDVIDEDCPARPRAP